jgi:hypothetical protein
MKSVYRNWILGSIILISVAMHFNHFPKDLMSFHVWRQTQTQTTIINFYEEDMNIFNPSRNDRGNGDGIFRMEFPLMQWIVACIYKVAGNHLILCRIFNFITGLFSIYALFLLLKFLFRNETIALIGAWTFNFSPSFYYHTINPMPDNLALCCSLWGIALFFYWYRKEKIYLLPLSGLFLSIGALCKLPFILYYSVPLSYFFFQFMKKGSKKENVLKAILITCPIILPLAWYILVIPQWGGNGIVQGITENLVPTPLLLYYLRYNLISTLPEHLLNYGSVLFFLAGFYFLFTNKAYKNELFIVLFVWSMAILAYYLFEANMIGTVHDYYHFPFFPLLFILVSYGASQLLILKNRFVKCLVFFLLLILPVGAYIRNYIRWDPLSPNFNKDLLENKEELRNAVPKDALCVAGNDNSHFIFFYYIDKKGWGFQEDNLDPQKLKKMIDDGAEYLYSDSREIENNENIKPYLDELIIEKGTIKIFHLKK